MMSMGDTFMKKMEMLSRIAAVAPDEVRRTMVIKSALELMEDMSKLSELVVGRQDDLMSRSESRIDTFVKECWPLMSRLNGNSMIGTIFSSAMVINDELKAKGEAPAESPYSDPIEAVDDLIAQLQAQARG